MKPPCLILLIFCVAGILCSFTISGIEYYFDSDPGPGNGNQLYPSRDAVSLDEPISTASLEPGIHRLFVRVKNDEAIWGLPQSASFMVPFTAPAFSERNVAAVECFFDTDPGVGNGNLIHGRNGVSLDELVSTAALEPGIHRLFTRAKDDEGVWSLPQSRSFLLPWAANSAPEITRLEYYVDADPGFGNGTQVMLTPGSSVSLDFAALVGEIEPGNHCLYLRAGNSEGSWGLPVCRQFSDGIPAHLSLTVNEGILTLSWEDLYGIDTYKVYSAPLPEGMYAEDASGTFGTSDWTAPVSETEKFFQVRSIYGE